MSIVQENSRYPIFTLRKHTHAITATEFVKIPISTTSRLITPSTSTSNSSNSLQTTCKPYVITADEKGNIKLWDLKTHRVVKEIDQAHEGSILSIRQLGITTNTEGTYNINSTLFGFVLTHSRDHTIKFWKLFDDQGLILLKEVYEMPVNALNFSNVDVMDNFLVSANTSDSNKFDIYDLKFLYVESAKHLTREFEAVDLFKQCQQNKYKFTEFNIRGKEEDDPENVNRVDKFGIIMKFLWITKEILAVGYESGHTLIVKVDIKAKKMTIQQISAHHFPNPILSISYNKDNNTLLTSSIRSKIIQHDLSNLQSEPQILKINLTKISNIVTYTDKLILSSWTGYIKFFQNSRQGSETPSYQEIAQFKKPKGLLVGNLNIIGNNQSNDIESQKQYTVKPNSLAVFIGDDLKKGIDPQYQRRLDRRDLMVLQKNFLSVGFDDGTVMVYDDI
ncbi:hypothetical protein WICPIJ_007033 [Wickerhamomyces pijperi]|uniref:ASTRA-associated protein 1 n=1 Tax=Wickerhamomyces pijperi TaxID=599730 RepID=A0A9P8Q0Y9_WICPI|nr:hypothetical protein WICPIJ_007033 [Wickerhamomyces pijperi]